MDKELAGYSNYGDVVDVAAPGGDMDKDVNNDGSPDGILSLIWAREGPRATA